jgi:hypothetical protein
MVEVVTGASILPKPHQPWHSATSNWRRESNTKLPGDPSLWSKQTSRRETKSSTRSKRERETQRERGSQRSKTKNKNKAIT